MKEFTKAKSIIEERGQHEITKTVCATPGYNFQINSLNENAKATSNIEINLLNSIKTSNVIIKQAYQDLNILNIKANQQPMNINLQMFCEDVYELIQKIFPITSIGMILCNRETKVIRFVNSRNPGIETLEIDDEHFEELYDSSQITLDDFKRLECEDFKYNEIWQNIFDFGNDKKMHITKKQENGYKIIYWMTRNATYVLKNLDGIITDNVNRKLLDLVHKFFEQVKIHAIGDSSLQSNVFSDLTYAYLIALKPAFVNKIIKLISEKLSAPIYYRKDKSDTDSDFPGEFYYVLIKYCNDVVDIVLSDSTHKEHNSIFSFNMDFMYKDIKHFIIKKSKMYVHSKILSHKNECKKGIYLCANKRNEIVQIKSSCFHQNQIKDCSEKKPILSKFLNIDYIMEKGFKYKDLCLDKVIKDLPLLEILSKYLFLGVDGCSNYFPDFELKSEKNLTSLNRFKYTLQMVAQESLRQMSEVILYQN